MEKRHLNKYLQQFLSRCMCIMLIFAATTVNSGAEVVDRIIAVVNSDIIVMSDLNKEIKPGVAKIKAQGMPEDQEDEEISKYRTYMLNQLINQTLIDQEIKRTGISISDEEVDAAIQNLREGKMMTEEVFAKEVEKNLGLDMDEYRQKVKEQLLRMRLINSEVESKVVVTEKDRELYYEKFEEEQANGKRYHLRIIIMRVSAEADEKEKKKILKKMEGVLEELNEGADFAKMAEEYSDKSLSGAGGDLGFFNFSDLSPQLKSGLADIKEGEFTSILETDMGYQILYVETIDDATSETTAEGSSDIDKQIYNASVNMKFQSWLMELRNRSHIKIVE